MALSTNLSASQKLKSKAQKFFLLPFAFLLVPASTVAQIIPDSSLPVNSIVSPEGNTNVITGGTSAGGNLFHSFREFSIPTNGTAFFNNGLDIQNIITRVTGGSISRIDGLLRANGIANFFLLNPNGIIFGPNARLDINGSFLASTARSLKFADGSELGTSATQTPPLLTVSVPVGLQFGQTTGSIVVEGKGQSGVGLVKAFESELNPLEVKPGNTLTLVGGEVRLDGGILQAPGGRVELGAIAQGTVEINSDRSLTFPSETDRGDVFFTNGAAINVIGSGGGNITINARNLDISGNTLLTNGIESSLGNLATEAGDITLNATGSIAIESSRIENNVNFDTAADGGNINIIARSLSLDNLAQVDAGNFGQGNAGNIFVQIDDFISLANGSSIESNAYNDKQKSGGIAGFVSIKAGNSIAIDNNSSIAAQNFGGMDTSGNTGAIDINAPSILLSNEAKLSTSTFGPGAGGDINIQGNYLSVTGGSTVEANTFGDGNAGNIAVNAIDSMNIDGASIESSSLGTGNAGYVFIEAGDTIAIANNSTISSDAYRFNNDTDTEPKNNGSVFGGTAGYIFVSAKNIAIDKSKLTADTFSGFGTSETARNQPGAIFMLADYISLSDESQLSTNTFGIGVGGDIIINSRSLSVTGGSRLEATTSGAGNAGNMIVNATDSVTISGTSPFQIIEEIFEDLTVKNLQGGKSSGLFTDTNNADSGEGGYIEIQTGNLTISDGGVLSARSKSSANGGDIRVVADRSVAITGGGQILTTTYSTGKAGSISISANDSVTISGIDPNYDDRLSQLKDLLQQVQNVLPDEEAASRFDTNGPSSSLSASTKGAGTAGNVIIEAGNTVALADKASISSATSEQGEAGSVFVTAGDTLSIANSSIYTGSEPELVTKGNGSGNGGEINIEARSVILSDNTRLVSSTFGDGNAGNVEIKAESFALTDGSRLDVGTFGTGDAGNINIDVDGSVEIAGNSTTILSDTQQADGNGGIININARLFSLTDSAALETSTSGSGKAGNAIIKVPSGDVFLSNKGSIESNSSGTGAAGDIQVTARNLQFNNQGSIAAETELSGKGGNINLQVQDLLLLRRDSNITTSAATAAGPGDGGNITINASNLVGLANGDIFANANNGRGGYIQINATGVFGIARREIRNDTTSDITATSELDPSLNGEVTINTPDVDPSQGLVELSVQTVDTENQVAKSCARRNSNQFTVTGRSGLPPSPNNYLNSEGVWVDLRTSQPTQENSPSPSRNSQFSRPDRIVEAQGWVRTADGKIVLTAQTSSVTPSSPALTPPGCN
ncbi:filamentous hemagglutinin N-terminal domain-containing protein [Argonema antarcticum]|uniref:two-partner secretion domain-containing protein n=1 Tax=Argonema antarcticum TaxID=2942763 RepID=UPI0020121810|nr:filamentous hemagglutinin N-terminal domain-containing protein [Argonema antarcticum]MCL1470607.1 filamentous hemagglutinin N-terminal domain-containing protein [Argonema antarcticum A004/B2]